MALKLSSYTRLYSGLTIDCAHGDQSWQAQRPIKSARNQTQLATCKVNTLPASTITLTP